MSNAAEEHRLKPGVCDAPLYQELKQIAHARLRTSRGQSLQLDTTTLVHESYLRLVQTQAGQRPPEFASDGHFLAYAAQVMRSVVVDLAREQASAHHGGGQADLSLDTALLSSLQDPRSEPAVLAVHEALLALQSQEPRLAQVVEMRYFGGLSEAEIAGHLGLTERSVRRDWQKARMLLLSMLSD